MDLTARDVHEQQFHDAWRGYNQEEVDDFLDKLAEVLDRLRRENESLRSRIADLDQVVATSRDTEAMLKKTLVSAQKAAEEALNNAKARAEQLITEAEERVKNANEQARERVRTAEEEARRKSEEAERAHAEKTRALDSSIGELAAHEAELKKRLRAFLEEEIQSLDALTEQERSPRAESSEVKAPQEQPRPAPQRLHAAPAGTYREREAPRQAQRPQSEQRVPRADLDDAGEPMVRRRRPVADEPHHRRGLRGFFWGGDEG